jgi:DNA replication protein DnaC
MNHHTIENMRRLGLTGMADEFERQSANPTMDELPFEHRIRVMVDQEITYRDNKRLHGLLKKAKLQINASIEDIDYKTARGLSKSQVLQLTTLEWVRQPANLVITGPTGTGKTWLSCAFANQACRQGLTAYFIRVPLLAEEFIVARAAGKFKNYLAQLVKFDLLVLDDWGITKFTPQAQHDVFELIDARIGPRSTIITSQFPIDSWHDALDNKIVADAILDRVVHSSHSIRLKGESLRPKVKKID